MISRKYLVFLMNLLVFSAAAQTLTPEPEPVSMVCLLANPERYHNKLICVEGILHALPGDQALYLSSTDADYCISTNAIWIDDNGLIQFAEGSSAQNSRHGKLVYVIGRFNSSPQGHDEVFGGLKHPFAGTLEVREMGGRRRYFDGATNLLFSEESLKSPPPPPLPDSLLREPCNISETHTRLRAMLPDSILADISSGTEPELSKYHMGLGRWIRNSWNLWKGGCLADYMFDTLRIFHPDDMSGFLLESFWNSLHHKTFDMRKYLVRLESFYVPNMAPKHGKCLVDSSNVRFSRLVTRRGSKGQKQVLIWGTCFAHRHGWLYSETEGWKRCDRFPQSPSYPADVAP
jgi:hypothetical protein